MARRQCTNESVAQKRAPFAFREQEIEELGSQLSEVALDFNTPKQQKPKQPKAFTGEGKKCAAKDPTKRVLRMGTPKK